MCCDDKASIIRAVRRCVLAVCVGMATTIVAIGSQSRSVLAAEASDLAGWWIAIDDSFVIADMRGEITAIVELLVIDAGNRVEDRMVRFDVPSLGDCLSVQLCSDAPLVGRARLAIANDTLTILERAEVPGRLDITNGDPFIRKTAITSTPRWTMQREAAGNRIRLAAKGGAKRLLVRIDPDRMRRLFAGFLFAEKPGLDKWRCFLANATAGDQSFAPIHTAQTVAPSFLENFLYAASYEQALRAAFRVPTGDDPDPEKRKLLGVSLERLMVEHFDDIRSPTTLVEMNLILSRLVFLRERAEGRTAQEVRERYPERDARGLDVPLTDENIKALALIKAGGPEVRRLFCDN